MKPTAINYLELPACNIQATQRFFKTVFNWQFQDYGPDYTEFKDTAITGGFYRSELESRVATGGALVVFYAENLPQIQSKIKAAGGSIIKPIFEFPGGKRFHFLEPSGNEFAVWSDT
ncbi:VOC family protein [Catenovulum maritimum]|uniref:Glyoxalase n=1 Tax=Catenovulum maritimum TaxID=1513271 RepID=A0A0J8GUD2_9ALTE|nr:VOC family protein [Catenovulum maritimum]KMT66385.1 glyoxalase [Catenovulum maritimum]